MYFAQNVGSPCIAAYSSWWFSVAVMIVVSSVAVMVVVSWYHQARFFSSKSLSPGAVSPANGSHPCFSALNSSLEFGSHIKYVATSRSKHLAKQCGDSR